MANVYGACSGCDVLNVRRSNPPRCRRRTGPSARSPRAPCSASPLSPALCRARRTASLSRQPPRRLLLGCRIARRKPLPRLRPAPACAASTNSSRASFSSSFCSRMPRAFFSRSAGDVLSVAAISEAVLIAACAASISRLKRCMRSVISVPFCGQISQIIGAGTPLWYRRGAGAKGCPFLRAAGTVGRSWRQLCDSPVVRSHKHDRQLIVFAVMPGNRTLTPSRNALGSRSDWAGRRVKQAGASAVVGECERVARYPSVPPRS